MANIYHSSVLGRRAAALTLCCYVFVISGGALLLHVHAEEHTDCRDRNCRHDSQNCRICKDLVQAAKGCSSVICGQCGFGVSFSYMAATGESLVRESQPFKPFGARGPPLKAA